MSNSFKNLQNKLEKLKQLIKPNEPKRREDAIIYLERLVVLVGKSYESDSPSDYMFLKTLTDATKEVKYFGGFKRQAKESLIIIEQRYNYIHGEGGTDIE